MASPSAVPVHVVLPASILAHSPSQQDGVPASVERAHRFFGCELIQEAGVLLRLPQVVMVTAQTTLQRFYYRKSLRDFDAFRVASACLFLAAKAEERPKRIRDVLSVFYALYKRRKWQRTRPSQQLLDLDSAVYVQWRDWLVMVERQVLIDLGFSVYNVMEHPHKYILYYVKLVGGSDALAQRAWGYLNDSLRIDLCVRYRSEVIASAALFLASRALQVKLPDDPHWYSLLGVDKRELYTAAVAIAELYVLEAPKPHWLEPLTAVNPFAVDDTVDEPVLEAKPMDTAMDGDREREDKLVDDGVAAVPSPVGPESVVAVVVEPPAAVASAAMDCDAVSQAAESVSVKHSRVAHDSSNDRAHASRRRDDESRRQRSPSPPRSRSRSDSRQRSRRTRDRSTERRRRRSPSRSRSRSLDRRRSGHRHSSSSSSSSRRRYRSRSTSRGRC